MKLGYSKIVQTLCIIKHKNLHDASEELGITQSALSAVLAKTEEEIGVTLFYRDRKKLVLTQEGEELLPCLITIRDDYERLREKARSLVRTEHPYINIGIVESPIFFSNLYLTDYMVSFEGKEIHKNFGNIWNLKEMLEKGLLDFVISVPPVQSDQLVTRNVMSELVVLAVPEAHSAVDSRGITVDQMHDLPFIGLKKHHLIRGLCDRYCGQNQFHPRYRYELDFPDYLERIRENGGGGECVFFCTETAFTRYRELGYRQVAVQGFRLQKTTALSYNMNCQVRYDHKRFIDYIMNSYQQYYQEYVKQQIPV